MSDMQMKYRERNEVLDASAYERRLSDCNSTGVAFFGAASSSGGGGVTGPHYSAAGLSPTMHMPHPDVSDYFDPQPQHSMQHPSAYADFGEDAVGAFPY